MASKQPTGGTTNVFMSWVENKVPKTWKTWFKAWKYNRRYEKFKREFIRSSPDFIRMWQICEFVKLAEKIYFYNNSRDNIILSSNGYAPGSNGFVIETDDVSITVKLTMDIHKIVMEIKRKKGNLTKPTVYTFIEGDWTDDHDTSDELLVDFVTSIIVDHTVMVLDWCYNRRTF